MQSWHRTRLGLLERATWCLQCMPQANSEHDFLRENGHGHWDTDPLNLQRTINSLGPRLLPHLQIGEPNRVFYNSLPTACPGIATLVTVYLDGLVGTSEVVRWRRAMDVTVFQCPYLPSPHPSFSWDIPSHATNSPACPPAQSLLILRREGTQCKPEIRSQACLAAKFVG